MATPNAGEDVEQEELSFHSGEKANGRATLKDSLYQYSIAFCSQIIFHLMDTSYCMDISQITHLSIYRHLRWFHHLATKSNRINMGEP